MHPPAGELAPEPEPPAGRFGMHALLTLAPPVEFSLLALTIESHGSALPLLRLRYPGTPPELIAF